MRLNAPKKAKLSEGRLRSNAEGARKGPRALPRAARFNSIVKDQVRGQELGVEIRCRCREEVYLTYLPLPLSSTANRYPPPKGLGRIGGLAVLSRRRQSHAPSSLKGRFSGDEFHAKMKSPPENLVSPLFYGTEKFFDFFQPTVESDFGNPKFTPAFASKDGFDKGPVAW